MFVTGNSSQDEYWLGKSANDGNTVAQYNLSIRLEFANNMDESKYWLKLAADNGHELAKKKLESLKYKLKSSEK
jgi:TPR repeat protein